MIKENKYYKARFIRGSTPASCFGYSACVLPISVGQGYHTGEKLAATLALINQSFSACTIILADSLQRHTLSIKHNISETEAELLAKSLSESWLSEQSHHVFTQLSIPVKIYHWDKWLHSDTYLQQKKLTENLYSASSELQTAFKLTTHQFMSRYQSQIYYSPENEENIRQSIFNYLIEECSIMPLWVNENFHFEIYPAKRTPAMATIYDLVVKPEYPNLLRYLQVELRSKIPNPIKLKAEEFT